MTAMAAISQPRFERTDQRATACRTSAMAMRTPRTMAANGSTARRQPDVVRIVKRNAER